MDIAVSACQRTDPADVPVNAICQMASVFTPPLCRVFDNEHGLTRASLER